MCRNKHNAPDDVSCARRQRLSARFARSRDGAAAIEFALLAIPYFLIVFAIIETFVAFTGEQLVSNAVDTLSRQIRTGQITAANTTKADFRGKFCDEVSILITCSGEDSSKLILDIRSFSKFAEIPDDIPRKNGDLDATDTFAPGSIASWAAMALVANRAIAAVSSSVVFLMMRLLLPAIFSTCRDSPPVAFAVDHPVARSIG